MLPRKNPTSAELAQLTLTTDNVIRSAYGNAIFSGISVEIIWECFCRSETADSFDELIVTAICAKEDLEEIARRSMK